MKNRSYNYVRSHQTDTLAGPISCKGDKRWVERNSKLQVILSGFSVDDRM